MLGNYGSDYGTAWWARLSEMNERGKTYLNRTVRTTSSRTGVVKHFYVRGTTIHLYCIEVGKSEANGSFYTSNEFATIVKEDS